MDIYEQILAAIAQSGMNGVNIFVINTESDSPEQEQEEESEDLTDYSAFADDNMFAIGGGGSGSSMLDAILQGPNTP